MEKTSTLVHAISSGTSEYIRLQTRSAKLELYERVTNIISSGISAGVIAVFGIFAFLFINVGLAFWLSELFHSFTKGFLCLGGFYVIVLGVYLLLKDKVAKNSVKNAVLHKVSKTMTNYDELLKEQEVVHAQVAISEKALKENFNELKTNIETLGEDIRRLKRNFVSEKSDDQDPNTHVGPKIPRLAITSLLDLVLDKVVFRNAGLVSKTIVPIIANALVTSKVFKETGKTSLIENLKLKFAKFL